MMTDRQENNQARSLRFEIAGLYYHIPFKERECGRWQGVLEPEPDNPHDEHAIRIRKAGGMTVGYVPRKKTWYIKKVMEKPYECEVRITPLYDKGEMMGLVGTCIVRGEGVGSIDRRRFRDSDIDGYDDEPVKCMTIDADSDAYRNGRYSIFIGSSADSIEVVGYEAAMRKVWRLEQLIREGVRHVASANTSKPWTSPRKVCLTVKLRMPWWRRDRVVLKKKAVEMLECDVYWIERRQLGVQPLRYRIAEKRGSGGGLSWADMPGMSLRDLFSIGSGILTTPSGIPSQPTDTMAAFDWETFEMQISSDEYFDFRW